MMRIVKMKLSFFFFLFLFQIGIIRAQGPYNNVPSKEIHIGGGSTMIRSCEANKKICPEPTIEKKIKTQVPALKNSKNLKSPKKIQQKKD